MGVCADGYGTCCVIVFSCHGQTSADVSWLINPDFPSPSIDRLACALTLNKTSNDIKQIRLDFAKFEVTQLKSSDILAAPTGCLQYFNKSYGYIESFNYRNITDVANIFNPSYFNNLNYAICIKREKSSCSVTYTNEDPMQIVNYDNDGLPLIPPRQAGVEIFNCPSDWLLISAVRLCGERLNDGSIVQDFYLDAPVTDISAGPIVVWFRSDEGYVGRGFKLHYQQNTCAISKK
ncbi:hypothetical protein RR46_13191 [Papilio xuthus]|uniref:CUB domain-containing protein n=1 Tax=Papilio xuthus TaxID=66420 RepID=A0A194PKR5_PAPXU|nr:hypothetical protein RR46_13191 [Papilio xuthus]